jgi:hypothetical protein
MNTQKRCFNDNHGRMVIRIRFCPTCGEVLNRAIAAARKCAEDAHAKMRRSQNTYCMDCGSQL